MLSIRRNVKVLFAIRAGNLELITPDVRPVKLHELVSTGDNSKFGQVYELLLEAQRIDSCQTLGNQFVVHHVEESSIHVWLECKAKAIVRLPLSVQVLL